MKKTLLVLSTLALLSCGGTLIASCTSQADRIKEEEARIKEEAKAFYYEQLEEWHEIKRLALKTTGVTASVKEERRHYYVKLIQIFPNSERWEDISKSIDKEEIYSEYDDFLWEIKKAKGWTDFD